MQSDQLKSTNSRPMAALFDRRHRLALPGGYWLQKDDENCWQLGREGMFSAIHISGNVPVGPGGSMDYEIREFVEAINAGR